MQGRSLLPALRGRTPAGWRTSMYYRYYHDPGNHNTRQHYGVRTLTHKLIYFWTKDQWELFDLRKDPYELHNLYGEPGQEALTTALKTELARLEARGTRRRSAGRSAAAERRGWPGRAPEREVGLTRYRSFADARPVICHRMSGSGIMPAALNSSKKRRMVNASPS